MAGVFIPFFHVILKRNLTQKAIKLTKGPHDYPKVTGTEFWKRKMRTIFRARDFDRDGYLTKKDYEMTVHRVSSYLDLDESQSKDFKKKRMEMWKEMCGDGNDPDTFRISQEEFDSNGLHLVNSNREFTVKYTSATFDTIDVDKDGFISPEEHKAFFYASGIPTEHSPAVFKMLDTNGDGLISREEFMQAMIDYMLNDEEDGPYNDFLGPIE